MSVLTGEKKERQLKRYLMGNRWILTMPFEQQECFKWILTLSCSKESFYLYRNISALRQRNTADIQQSCKSWGQKSRRKPFLGRRIRWRRRATAGGGRGHGRDRKAGSMQTQPDPPGPHCHFLPSDFPVIPRIKSYLSFLLQFFFSMKVGHLSSKNVIWLSDF